MLENYEEFTEQQIKLLEKYVTNTRSSIFVLRNLPEVIKGALFSRYSRSSLGLRSLLLKEFINNNEETNFVEIAGLHVAQNSDDPAQQLIAIKKAQNFYDRILDGYGDDSIGELGGAHLAIENISMLAAKAIEDCRVGGSPLEKSTRYIYFDQKVNGEYLFYREPILMTSAYRDKYLNTCNMLFDTYGKLIPPLTAYMEENHPREAEVSKVAYTAAIRAKVLDCLRGILPASTLTNMGMFGNGRFFEGMLHKMHCHNLAELQDIGRVAQEELAKVIPSFVKRADSRHKHHKTYQQYHESWLAELKQIASVYAPQEKAQIVSKEAVTRLISYDLESVYHVAAALLYASSNKSFSELYSLVKRLPEEDISRILDVGAHFRDNRRHKSPRALELAHFTFEIIADFGSYRDLHRHRLLTQERQLLTCDYGYYVPSEIVESGFEKEYCNALEAAQGAFDLIVKEFPEEAQYIVPMAYHVHWYFHINLRALQWMCELRSQAAGHSCYRLIVQTMAREVCKVLPVFEKFFKFVDFTGYELGRIHQEQRKVEKQQAVV